MHQLDLPQPLKCEHPIQLGSDASGRIRCTHVWSNEEMELSVEAKLWCMGMEVHSFVIGTHLQEPFEASNNGDCSESMKRNRHYVTWNDVLVFPFRWVFF